MIAVVFAIGLLAAVVATCVAGGFIEYGWEYYHRFKLYAMYGGGVVLIVSGLVLVVAVDDALPTGETFWATVFAVVYNAIVWHEIWKARRKMGLTRSIRARINRRALSSQ